MTPIPIPVLPGARPGMAVVALWLMATSLGAQTPDLVQRFSRIDQAVTIVEQVVQQLGAESQGRRAAGSAARRSPCLASDAAWRGCLGEIQGAAALISDIDVGRRTEAQLPYTEGLVGRLMKGDTAKDLALLKDILASLKLEKRKLLETMNSPKRPSRSPQ